MKTAFLFSGQGAQQPGMGKSLYDHFAAAREVFDTAGRTLGRDIAALCFEGTKEELSLTHNTQVCMLAADLAAGFALRDSGVRADCAAGFSLGEYAALVFAGAIALEDVFPLVQIRADAMQAAVPEGEGAMAALMGADRELAAKICAQVTSGYVVPVNYNSPVQTVISGEKEAVKDAVRAAKKEKVRGVRLPVSAPFHCRMMEPAAQVLAGALQKITIREPEIPVYSNCTGDVIRPGDDIADLLVRQAKSPVEWISIMTRMSESGVTRMIECGTGDTLKTFVGKTIPDMDALNVDTFEAVTELAAR